MWYPGKKVADSDKVRLGFSQGKNCVLPTLQQKLLK